MAPEAETPGLSFECFKMNPRDSVLLILLITPSTAWATGCPTSSPVGLILPCLGLLMLVPSIVRIFKGGDGQIKRTAVISLSIGIALLVSPLIPLTQLLGIGLRNDPELETSKIDCLLHAGWPRYTTCIKYDPDGSCVENDWSCHIECSPLFDKRYLFKDN